MKNMISARLSSLAACALLAVILTFIATGQALAQSIVPAGTCTWDGAFTVSQFHIIGIITDQISCVLFGPTYPNGNMFSGTMTCNPTDTVTHMLFSSIADSTGPGSFNFVLRAALLVYVLMYGISFTVGIVQLTLSDFIIRIAKFAAIIALATPGSWVFFSGTFGRFFVGGMNDLITLVTGGNSPFSKLDEAISWALSARTFVTMIGMMFSGPYGLVLGLLMLASLGSFVGALLQAIWIYLMALVMMAFLLGMGPIFIACALFSKTRHLFDGWINQLINAMLQPVFLFTFFSFFVQLVFSALQNILRVDICYMPSQGLFRGTQTDMVMPRPAFNPRTGVYGEPYGGPIGWADPFPFSVFDILAFAFLTKLTKDFNGMVLNIAREIASASTSLNMSSSLSNAMNPGKVFADRAQLAAEAATGRITNASRNTRNTTAEARDRVPGAGGGRRS